MCVPAAHMFQYSGHCACFLASFLDSFSVLPHCFNTPRICVRVKRLVLSVCLSVCLTVTLKSKKKIDMCVPDSDQSGFYSQHFQLSPIRHSKIHHFNMVKNSNTSRDTIISHTHSFNTEPAAPPGQASLASRVPFVKTQHRLYLC